MHVLSHQKRTLFWIITGTEVAGIFIMLGLLAYKKYFAATPAPSKQTTVTTTEKPTVRPAEITRPATAAPKPAENITSDGETEEANDLDKGEQGSSWQLYEEATANRPNSAASGPPLPKVIKKPKIVVIKSKQVLMVYDGDKLLRTYLAATGTNPGDKVKSGDRRTPEGEFYICVKNPKSRFVLSLGLSYPSYDDARRGLEDGLINQSQYNHIISELNLKRQPPWNTKLGGEIMIHGVRQGGRTTAGCIALENDDIRELYPKIPVGTKVIVKP